MLLHVCICVGQENRVTGSHSLVRHGDHMTNLHADAGYQIQVTAVEGERVTTVQVIVLHLKAPYHIVIYSNDFPKGSFLIL